MIRVYLLLLFTAGFPAYGENLETCQAKVNQRFAHLGPIQLAAMEHRVELKVHASAWWGFRGMQLLVDDRELVTMANESEELGLTFAQDRRSSPEQEASAVAKRIQEVVNTAFIKKSTLRIDFTQLRAVVSGFRGTCLIDGYSLLDVIKEEAVSKPQPQEPPVPPAPPVSVRGDRSDVLPAGQVPRGMRLVSGGDR